MRRQVDLLTPLLAVLATWAAAWTWASFSKAPGAFLGPLLVSCLLIAGSGAGLGALGLPWHSVLLCQAIVLLVWINHHLASGPSFWSWIPTRGSLGELGSMLERSVQIAQNEPSPVPAGMTDFAAF